MDKQQLIELTEQGYSTRQIAKITNKSQTSVRYWLGKHNLATGRKHNCKCGETKKEMFHPGRYSECKKCRKRYQLERFRKNKKKFVEYKGGRCEKCGYNNCLGSLDFHHKDPDKKDPNWRKMRRWSFERVKKELDKCILICKNCHGEIHYGV